MDFNTKSFRAKHGYDGSTEEGFLRLDENLKMEFKNLDDIADYVLLNYPKAIGFTLHPNFFKEGYTCNYIVVVNCYSTKSSTSSSWPLFLFDQNEANIEPDS